MTHPTVEKVTDRIRARSAAARGAYLDRCQREAEDGPRRARLACGNLAHAIAACGAADKAALAGGGAGNIGIVTAYNDMLSAHQPYERFPGLIREAARTAGGTAQVAGGVPAMCDGVTQGQPGMELSLFSRDVIALAAGIALSHNCFDAAVFLGICDKIVPGLVIAAASFGHLPAVFIPSGPMPSGLPNDEKSRIRQQYAKGEIGRAELLKAEMASYHGPGTCTFYGTANSNQMLMEFMGLHLPGASFVNPNTPLRDALTRAAARRALEMTALGNDYTPVSAVLDERAFVNGMVGLHATGGSTNLVLHLVAMARAAGVLIDWEDMSDLSAVTPLMARVYPNGLADVNHFHAAGGLGFVIATLLDAGLLHNDVQTILGDGLERFCVEPHLAGGQLEWRAAAKASLDEEILRPAERPFDAEGGLRVVDGNLGRAIVKVSAVKKEHYRIEAPARVFDSQADFVKAFNAGKLERDFVAVLPCQGPSANGMPELHKLTPYLGVLQNRGFKVALLTDGRMSGASGKVLAAIQVTPEAVAGGTIGKLRNGDMITIDATTGVLSATSTEGDPAGRPAKVFDLAAGHAGMGRELFGAFRAHVSGAEQGASALRSGS